MKHKFIKYLGRVTEELELGFEEKWIYVHYTKGSIEKTACLLKNEGKSEWDYLEGFLNDNSVSEEMKKDVRSFFEKGRKEEINHWSEFSTFLMKTLSLSMVFGISIAVCVYGGYKLGNWIDTQYNFHSIFTVVSTLLGIGVGTLTIYSMILKYIKLTGTKGLHLKHKNANNTLNKEESYPIIDVTIDEVRKAIRKFSEQLPKGVYRTILVQDDNSIDFKQLASILNGIPSQKFYMSKETYDLFEEEEKQIATEMDHVQRAVDQYVKEHREYPMLQFDPQHRVNYFQLRQGKYLKTEPQTQFYITDLDGLITHIKPTRKKTSS
ncbi:AtpZ/AtpI family protein [Neobacillus dielmonensis]|uniref:AtpZ/AtpI family protein n=1 Tax=Neobacillus dielmonensis TaxID=1347369 RepID=UPI0005A85CFC|nr:AtpZ/AtpI family protein [Neobacillus dielmonensis]